MEERRHDWREVERVLSDAELKEQTARCMNCGQPFCHAYGCPLGNLVPDQNRAVAQGDWKRAYELLSVNSDFPEFTSRICPALCEASCVHGLDEEAVSDLPEKIRNGANRQLPAYSKIAKVEPVLVPFEKTPKMSIKRFLYK